jgi:hypothetical protein
VVGGMMVRLRRALLETYEAEGFVVAGLGVGGFVAAGIVGGGEETWGLRDTWWQ